VVGFLDAWLNAWDALWRCRDFFNGHRA
jgi:hypothetical protein